MKARLKEVSIFLVVLSFFCLSLALPGCTPGNGPTSMGYSELLFWSDGSTIHTGSVNGSTRTSLGSATIPGIPGTYTRTGTLVTVTMPNHNLPQNGFWVDLVFSAGTGGTATSGKYQVTIVDDNTFTVNDSASGTITGGAVLWKPAITLDATYSQSGTTITITLANHNLKTNDILQLHFTSGTAVDAAIKIASIVDANTFTVTAASSATTSGDVQVTVGGNYTIFSIAMHPSGKWVYTTSTYDCASGEPFCWGSGLISRFSVDWNTGGLTFEASTVTGTTTNSAPVTAKFSPDGTLLFNQDDDLDGLQMWNVNSTDGTLTLAASSANDVTFMHGVCVSSDGTRVYNGNNVFSFTSSSITSTYAGSGGESNVIIGSTLYSADRGDAKNTWDIRTFSLSNPDAPSVIATASTNTLNQAREIAVSSDGKRIVSAGWGGLISYDYDGASITQAVGAGSTQYIDGGGSTWPTSSSVTRKMFRNVNLNNAGNMIATAYFTIEPSSQMGLPPSGVMLFNLAADGSLSLAADYSDATYARVAKFFKKP